MASMTHRSDRDIRDTPYEGCVPFVPVSRRLRAGHSGTFVPFVPFVPESQFVASISVSWGDR